MIEFLLNDEISITSPSLIIITFQYKNHHIRISIFRFCYHIHFNITNNLTNIQKNQRSLVVFIFYICTYKFDVFYYI